MLFPVHGAGPFASGPFGSVLFGTAGTDATVGLIGSAVTFSRGNVAKTFPVYLVGTPIVVSIGDVTGPTPNFERFPTGATATFSQGNLALVSLVVRAYGAVINVQQAVPGVRSELNIFLDDHADSDIGEVATFSEGSLGTATAQPLIGESAAAAPGSTAKIIGPSNMSAQAAQTLPISTQTATLAVAGALTAAQTLPPFTTSNFGSPKPQPRVHRPGTEVRQSNVNLTWA